MGIYYSAVDFENKKLIEPPGTFANKFPGIIHPNNPFPGMIVLMNRRGYKFELVEEFYEEGYEDITETVYAEYLSILETYGFRGKE